MAKTNATILEFELLSQL